MDHQCYYESILAPHAIDQEETLLRQARVNAKGTEHQLKGMVKYLDILHGRLYIDALHRGYPVHQAECRAWYASGIAIGTSMVLAWVVFISLVFWEIGIILGALVLWAFATVPIWHAVKQKKKPVGDKALKHLDDDCEGF